MLKRGKLSIEEIAEDTNLSLETVVELQRQKEL
jgi:orotate phosphoribosyltransferase-like protein